MLEISGEISPLFFEDEEVITGLPIFPSEAFSAELANKGLPHACDTCGYVADEKVPAKCTDCGGETWKPAIRSKRIA
ncbi:hypothetical protein [Foetidibacter luteolus]|uniref:hypothetical protein n=1 Tax=Foetidibacter luteolus TaxID=2608880 RepID=UPI001A97F32E|nr:hypothetical protein [Foetidibacter luteolus]